MTYKRLNTCVGSYMNLKMCLLIKAFVAVGHGTLISLFSFQCTSNPAGFGVIGCNLLNLCVSLHRLSV